MKDYGAVAVPPDRLGEVDLSGHSCLLIPPRVNVNWPRADRLRRHAALRKASCLLPVACQPDERA
ncbi:MAG: hypothetical protein EA405_02565 [Rhodospirillales bacterium]|nr:MAG: hypothetical protein EA405_02565 [Rhodospirillales bacterium]